MNARLSQEVDSLMNMIQARSDRAIGSAINDRAIPEIQNVIGSVTFGP